MRISDWSSDVCSSDLAEIVRAVAPAGGPDPPGQRQAGGDPTPLREIGLHHRQAPFDQCRVEGGIAHQVLAGEIGRASCRERVGQYVEISVVAVSIKQKNTKTTKTTNR